MCRVARRQQNTVYLLPASNSTVAAHFPTVVKFLSWRSQQYLQQPTCPTDDQKVFKGGNRRASSVCGWVGRGEKSNRQKMENRGFGGYSRILGNPMQKTAFFFCQPAQDTAQNVRILPILPVRVVYTTYKIWNFTRNKSFLLSLIHRLLWATSLAN